MQFPHPFTTSYPFYANPFVPSPYASAGNTDNQPSASLAPYSNFGAVQSGHPTAVTFLIPPGASTINFTWRAENAASAIPPQLHFTSAPNSTHAAPPHLLDRPEHNVGANDPTTRNTPRPSRLPSPADSVRSAVTYAPPSLPTAEPAAAADSAAGANVAVSTAPSEHPDPGPSTGTSRTRSPSDAASPGPEQTSQPKKRRKTYFSTELFKRKINNVDNEYTQWYESDADHKRHAPLKRICDLVDRRTRTGRLYVHTHARGVQAWMWTYERGPDGVKPEGARKVWVEVQVGAAHPRLWGYVLHFLGSGEPRWVKAHSAVVYSIRNRTAAGDDDDYEE